MKQEMCVVCGVRLDKFNRSILSLVNGQLICLFCEYPEEEDQDQNRIGSKR